MERLLISIVRTSLYYLFKPQTFSMHIDIIYYLDYSHLSIHTNPLFYILVYIDSGRTVTTIATIKFTLASASANYWRVGNFSSHATLFIESSCLNSNIYRILIHTFDFTD